LALRSLFMITMPVKKEVNDAFSIAP
jgi:hypothetical protein